MTVMSVDATLKELLAKDLRFSADFLTSDMSVREARMVSITNSLVKKWKTDDAALEATALSNFERENAYCDNWLPPDGTEYVDDILFTARHLMERQLNSSLGSKLCLAKAALLGRHGPGASAGKSRRYDAYSKYFGESLSTCKESLYKHYMQNCPTAFVPAEKVRQAAFGVDVVQGSAVSCVAKDRTAMRTICKEPSLEMYYQLGLGNQICDILQECYSINLSTQPDINSKLARQGSVDGVLATVDLKSASNLISYKFVEWIIDRYNFGVLNTVRCGKTSIPTETGRKWVDLKMFSSMGNGFTFPLQTLIFATLLRATYQHLGLKAHNAVNFGVFGDDIVINSSAYHIFRKVLERAGFIVNELKSHYTGSFRESCGKDYFRGHNVRGAYLKGVKTHEASYTAFNVLARWSAGFNIIPCRTLAFLRGLVALRPVPFDESDDAGHKCPASVVTVPKRDRNGSLIYKCHVPVSDGIDFERLGNAEGALRVAIGGFCRNERLGLRSSTTRYKVKKRVTPSWDYIPFAGASIRDYELIYLMIDPNYC